MPDAVGLKSGNRLGNVIPAAPLTGMDGKVQAILLCILENLHKGLGWKTSLVARQVQPDDPLLDPLSSQIGYLRCQRRAFVAVDTGNQACGDTVLSLGVACAFNHPIHHLGEGKPLGFAQSNRCKAQLQVDHIIGGGICDRFPGDARDDFRGAVEEPQCG